MKKTILLLCVLSISFIGGCGISYATPAVPAGTGCAIYPPDHIWNTRIDNMPVHPLSDTYVDAIGANTTLHPDFGSGVWPPGSDSPIGIPYDEVLNGQMPVDINYTAYGDESDPGPFPIPPDAQIEGGPSSTGDRHVIVLDTDNCILYELFYAFPVGGGTSWNAHSGAEFDLTSYALRPDGWTSADAAGLPIFPGLVRYDEVQAGAINHAIRFTAQSTQDTYVWPARHHAGSANTSLPPMGMRFRLKADFDISPFHPDVQVILQAMKTYGIILADNGTSWFISGAPNEFWDNGMLGAAFDEVHGYDFEAVDVSSLMLDMDSGQVRQFDEHVFVPSVLNAP